MPLHFKKLRQKGEGEWEYIVVDVPENLSPEDVLRDVYIAHGWGEVTEEEYNEYLTKEPKEE